MTDFRAARRSAPRGVASVAQESAVEGRLGRRGLPALGAARQCFRRERAGAPNVDRKVGRNVVENTSARLARLMKHRTTNNGSQ